jgi:tetratricopeptide (TPR) repeat protein
MEDESNATKAYEEVLAFDPSNFNALLFLMQEYNKLAAPEKAIEYATRFAQKYPSDGRGELEAGKAYLALKDNARAMTALTRAAEMLPNEAAPHSMLGDLHIQNSRFADAQQQYEEALSLSPDDVDLYVKIGQAHLLMGKPQLALEKTKGVRQKNYDNMALLRVVALSEFQTGDAAAARTDLKRYIENGPPDLSVYLALGELEEGDREYGKAMQLYERAEALDRSDPAVLQHIAALKEKTGGAAVAAGGDEPKDDDAYAPRMGSPRFTIGMLSGVIFAGGAAGGFAMDWLLKKDYTAYQKEQNSDQVASLHKKIAQKRLYRNTLYGLAGAAGVGLALTITIPLLR